MGVRMKIAQMKSMMDDDLKRERGEREAKRRDGQRKVREEEDEREKRRETDETKRDSDTDDVDTTTQLANRLSPLLSTAYSQPRNLPNRFGRRSYYSLATS